jgi:PAS domain S-box-containing protein
MSPPTSTDPTLPEPQDTPAHHARVLHQERLRLYRNTLGSALGSQVVLLPLVLVVLWDAVPRPALLAWGAAVLLMLLLRVGLLWPVRAALRSQPGLQPTPAPSPPQAKPGDAGPAALVPLWRLRAGVILSGLVWGTAAFLLFPAVQDEAQLFVIFVCAGMAAGSLVLTSFDLRASLTFALLALAPLMLQLLRQGDAAGLSMAVMVGLFVGFLGLTGWRAQRNLVEAMRVRADEQLRNRELLQRQVQQQQLSAELDRQRTALQVTLDSMAQGILSIGSDGRTQFYNQRLTDLTGIPVTLLATRPTMVQIAQWQEQAGHYGPALQHFDSTSRDVLQRWMQGEEVQFPARYLRRTHDGRMLEVHSRYLADGVLVRTFADVSAFFEAQQRLQASQQQAAKLALVAAHTQDAVAILDPDRRIEWVNEGFTRMTGWPLEEAVGRFPVHLLHGEGLDIQTVARLDEALLLTGSCTGELQQRARDGRLYWCALEVQAIRDDTGAVRQYISISRDISQRKAGEAALRAARDEAESASRAKSDFLSAMSHELRTPMNAILGFAQLLALDPQQPLNARQREQVQQILRAGGHLLELINDVLDLARVEAGKQPMLLEPVPVTPLLQECLALVRPLAQARGIVLHGVGDGDAATGLATQAAAQVRADRLRLRQVMLNLLSNAIKYNREGGEVRCAVSHATGPDGRDELHIAVQDTGPGLDAAERERLFQPFERLGAEGGEVEGAGIGLALSRQLMALMEGRIELHSASGEGSTFVLVLPCAEGPPAAAPVDAPRPAVPVPPPGPASGPTSDPASGRLRQLLYIEDNPVNLMLMEAALADQPGVRLATAPLPALGLDLAFNTPPDLVLLDIQLPGMDGFEVLRRLRADPRTAQVPVVAVSANAMLDDLARAREAGFDDYLTKPLDLQRLRALVQQPLSRRPATLGSAWQAPGDNPGIPT